MKIRYLAVFFAASVSALATNVGDSRTQVISERGKPLSQVEVGSVVVLYYAYVSIKCRDDLVVEIRDLNAGHFSVVHSDIPKPVRKRVVEEARGGWTTDYKAALAGAADEHRNVFLFFTGSDWCGWCKKLNGEILSTPEFKAYAEAKLVLVELDFPRQKELPAAVKSQNQELQRQFGIKGFPTVMVLNSKGEHIGRLGYQPGGPEPFIARLKALEQ
jgi:thioredoxin-related protein